MEAKFSNPPVLDPMTARMLQTFEQSPLTEEQAGQVRVIRESFINQARIIAGMVPAGPERTVALRKLRESKDAAVIGIIYPPAPDSK